jgi:iron complex transport system permease protein
MRKSWLVIRPQQLPVSFHLDQRVPTVLLVLGLVTLMAIVLNVGQGEYPIPPLEVLKTILDCRSLIQIIPSLLIPYAYLEH